VHLALAITGLMANNLPWLTAPSANLSPAAYDLAEWASLHPLARGGDPPLLTSLLLRLPFMLLALGIVYSTNQRPNTWFWWLQMLLIGAITATLIPPAEFFTSGTGDPNYRQQALLASTTIVAGGLGLFTRPPLRLRPYLVVTLAVLGATTTVAGLLRAQTLLQHFTLQAQPGISPAVMVVAFIVLGTGQLWQQQVRKRKHASR